MSVVQKGSSAPKVLVRVPKETTTSSPKNSSGENVFHIQEGCGKLP
jgi:hypothetical protein